MNSLVQADPGVQAGLGRAVVADETLAASFPASDPPGWTPGIARPSLESTSPPPSVPTTPGATTTASTLSGARRAGQRKTSPVQALISVAGVAGVVLLVPFAIMLVALPVVLAVRGVYELIRWMGRLIG